MEFYKYKNIIIHSVDKIDHALSAISRGKVTILSGAGVSTNSGIPDYRSTTGIFKELASEFPELEHDPTLVFNREYITNNPRFNDSEVYLSFREKMRSAQPCPSHVLAVYLHERGLLQAVITQNIDGLYQKAGLPESHLVEFHGNSEKGDVVLYGDSIPSNKIEQAFDHMKQSNVCLVMGTSLQVSPFCALPNLLPKDGCRILVDKYVFNALSNNWNKQHYTTTTRICKQTVTLRSHFGSTFSERRKKWKDQYLYSGDVCDFSNNIMLRME